MTTKLGGLAPPPPALSDPITTSICVNNNIVIIASQPDLSSGLSVITIDSLGSLGVASSSLGLRFQCFVIKGGASDGRRQFHGVCD